MMEYLHCDSTVQLGIRKDCPGSIDDALQSIAIDDYAKIATRNFLPRCTTFLDQIPIKSLRIRNWNAMHFGKKFLDAIYSAIVYCVE